MDWNVSMAFNYRIILIFLQFIFVRLHTSSRYSDFHILTMDLRVRNSSVIDLVFIMLRSRCSNSLSSRQNSCFFLSTNSIFSSWIGVL
eukprot:Gb_09106 [translate_table: standard]